MVAPVFTAATGVEQLEYVVLLPPVQTCVHRAATRRDHAFADGGATRKMHAEFAAAAAAERHVVDLSDGVEEIVPRITAARGRSRLAHRPQPRAAAAQGPASGSVRDVGVSCGVPRKLAGGISEPVEV